MNAPTRLRSQASALTVARWRTDDRPPRRRWSVIDEAASGPKGRSARRGEYRSLVPRIRAHDQEIFACRNPPYQRVNASFHILKDCRSYSQSPVFGFSTNRRSELRAGDAPIQRRTFGNAEGDEVWRRQLPERGCSGEKQGQQIWQHIIAQAPKSTCGRAVTGRQNRPGAAADRFGAIGAVAAYFVRHPMALAQTAAGLATIVAGVYLSNISRAPSAKPGCVRDPRAARADFSRALAREHCRASAARPRQCFSRAQ